MKKITLSLASIVLVGFGSLFSQDANKLTGELAASLRFRNVGPALTSGRVAEIAIHPSNPDKWIVGVASGGVWITENHGTTFSPVFDSYGSYSIGHVAIAPSNPSTVWVGTGENNNQRSVAYGDGVYKSVDGGKSYTNMGLKLSEHIGNIVIHPTDENTLWVAAYGPVWSAGGERGVYKSVDGGKTWNRTLFVSDETGIAEVQIDPFNPSILYASAHQRRRHEFTYVGGGPESTVYKSMDGGQTWFEINNGLPQKEMGRIGLAVSPVEKNWIYAIVEARGDKGGFFLSTNGGMTWTKQSKFNTSGNYYQEIMCDPKDKNKVFAMDTWLHHTENAGKTFVETGEDMKHVDNHSIWIDPNNTNHWIVGCDGGIYETYSHGKEWRFYDNLPITQFYKVTTDNSLPFYYIYGGTQDNNSMGGPSATQSDAGILNSDWFITNGGDGFESAVDWENPNIVYAQSQYGWLVRYDKKSGEKVAIQPMPGKNDSAYRWNWDAPLLVSPHDSKTIYFAANKVFKSSNRGDDWQVISSDLTQKIDRNKLPVMGQVWSMDAVMKNASTTIYGNVVALDESPKKKGLLYAGTDDGTIQVSENDGQSWSKYITFSGVPKNTRVNMLLASLHDENVVFAVFNNHRSGDFKPYLMKSTNKGKSWTSIVGNLPTRGSVYAIRQDHVDPNLLFVGTEFGAYCSTDGGQNWHKLGGLPTIAIYDLDIQQRENDLVAASFGRGFYVLDNYAALRSINEVKDKKAVIFPIKDALLYVPATPFGLSKTGSQGHNLYAAENPKFGANFTYYVKDKYQTEKEKRQEKESNLEKEKKAVEYPSFEAIRAEGLDNDAQLIFRIFDDKQKEIRRIVKPAKQGFNHVTWNLRSESTHPVRLQKKQGGRYDSPEDGLLVVPGTYTVRLFLEKNGMIEEVAEARKFVVKSLNNTTLPASNPAELMAMRDRVSELNRQISGASSLYRETSEKWKLLQHAAKNYPQTDMNLLKDLRSIEENMQKAQIMLWGDNAIAAREFETAPSIASRLGIVEYQLFESTTNPTKTQETNLKIVEEQYAEFRQLLNQAIVDLRKVEEQMKNTPIPYTKGANESWKKE